MAEQSTRLTRATNGPYLPHIGTSPSVVDTRSAVQFTSPPTSGLMDPSTERSALREVLALSFGDQIREILAALSLNKSQLAEVLGVSRPTLYDWLEGKEPNASNAQRLSDLLRLLVNEGVMSSRPLSARFVRQALSQDKVGAT